MGYVTQEVMINNRTEVNITLNADSRSLNEVVVVGYGTQSKKSTTGAIATIKASDLDQTNAVSIDNLIQGKAAGLNVNSYTAQPGGNLDITIRGALSPNGSNKPLYVIDGVPLTDNFSTEYTAGSTNASNTNFAGGIDRDPLNTINPADIASIDILKDASATAIYGSAAANGVILITTKKGKDGKAVVSYSGSYSIQTPKKYLQPLDATQFEQAVDTYGGERYLYNNNIYPYGNTNPSTVAPYVPFFTPAQIANAGVGTNYIKDYVLQDGRIDDQSVSLSGGNANTKVYTSFNYFDQDGLLRYSGFKRYTGRINLEQKLGSRVDFNVALTYAETNALNSQTGSAHSDGPSLIQSGLTFAPNIGPYKPDGTFSSSYYLRTPNPASFADIVNNTGTKRFFVAPNLQINIIDGLKVNFTGGIDQTTSQLNFFVPVSADQFTVPEGDAQINSTSSNNYSLEGYATYDKSFKDSKISAVLGSGYYQTTYHYYGLDAVGFNTDAFGLSNIGIASDKLLSSVGSDISERTKLSQFVRLNYTYLDRFIFQFTGRRDGTSNFPVDHPYGYFPGVSGAWLINQESFLKDFKSLSQLKLRLGYGTSGNESITTNGNYAYSLYSFSNSYQYLIGNTLRNSGATQTQIGNPNLVWETDISENVGLDYGFFNNRISGTIDYFRRTAKNLLDYRPLPSANAIGSQAFNTGSTRSTGIELSLVTQNIVGKSFSWTSNFTFGTANTYWVTRNQAVTLAPYIGLHDPIGEVYGWKTDGLIRTPAEIPSYQKGAILGNIRYVDVNGDGKLDINDVVKLGNSAPTATFGFGNTFKYGGFDLSLFIYGNYGGVSYDQYRNFTSFAFTEATPGNVDIHSLNTWTTFNPNGKYPGLAADAAAANNPTGTNDFLMTRNSYFARLKNVTLGYNLPSSLFSKTNSIKSIRVFIDFENLGYITNTSGLDPEMDRGSYINPYPTALTTAFGINAQF